MRNLIVIALLLAACKDKPAPPSSAPVTTTPSDASTQPAEPPVPTPPAPSTSEATALAKSNNNFALDLWSRLPAGNLAVSPTSIALAIAMTWGGAKGATADEIRKVMRFEGEPDQVLSRWGQISLSLQDPARTLKLKIANRLFGDKRYEWDTIYFRIINESFKARIEVADFRGNADEERKRINVWVEKATEHRIKDLLPARSVDAETRMILVNAIYFLADWASPFAKRSTMPSDFHVSASATKQVPTMHQTTRYRYAAGKGASLIELPYEGNSASMYILVPDKVDGLAAVEAALTDTLKLLQGKLTEQSVSLALPRFTIDPPSSLELGKLLQAMGMKQAFDPAHADFTGIAKPADPKDGLVISAVFHKAFVKVDEKGTEAAAATAVAMPRGGPPPKAIELRVDHPFLFLIVDRESGLILFMGRVVDPS